MHIINISTWHLICMDRLLWMVIQNKTRSSKQSTYWEYIFPSHLVLCEKLIIEFWKESWFSKIKLHITLRRTPCNSYI